RSPVTEAQFNHQGTVVATGSTNGRVVLWDAGTGALLQCLQHDREVTGISFSPDDRLVATSSADGTVAVWDTASGLQVKRIPLGGLVRSVEFSADGTKILVVAAVTVAQGPARLYD